MFDIRPISQKQALSIILDREPLGLFFCKENQRFVAIDNSYGDAFVEEFESFDLCKFWLNGMFEVCCDGKSYSSVFSEWLCDLSQESVSGLGNECINAIDNWPSFGADESSLFYMGANEVQKIKSDIAEIEQESPYALADCIFQAALDIGKDDFVAGCFAMDIVNNAQERIIRTKEAV